MSIDTKRSLWITRWGATSACAGKCCWASSGELNERSQRSSIQGWSSSKNERMRRNNFNAREEEQMNLLSWIILLAISAVLATSDRIALPVLGGDLLRGYR